MYRKGQHRVLKKTSLYKCETPQATANLWVRQKMKVREEI